MTNIICDLVLEDMLELINSGKLVDWNIHN